jgi:hypothetical protein
MKALLKSLVAGLLAALLTAPAAFAQERPAFSPQELDQMLAPIALYPDPLLSQILMAATYPLEIVQAARWSRANSQLKGQDAVRAVESMDWDPSVKSLVAFPQVLYRMDEQLDWTERLGEAFLDQEPHVMDAIQGLRQRAEQAGNLRSSEQIQVTREDGQIAIEPAQPQVVYVPYYDPVVVYGGWWWPAYPPVYWGPFPGYYAWPGYAPGFFWGTGIAVSWGFFFGHVNWPQRQVVVVHNQVSKVVVNRQGTVIRRTYGTPDHKPAHWQHDPVHRRNVPYRHVALRQASNQPPAGRSGDRLGPAPRPESHNARPDARGAAPQMRPQLAAPQPRPGRTAPQMRDRWPERIARADVQAPRSRVPDPRPAAAAPRFAPVTRPAPAPSPIARAGARPAPPAAMTRPVPRPAPGPTHRAGLPAPAQPGGTIPRAAVSAPGFLPRMDSHFPQGGAGSYGGGSLRGGSGSAVSRGNGRRF